MQIDTRKLKKLIIKAVPYVAFSYVGNLIGFAYRTAEGDGFQEKILPFKSFPVYTRLIFFSAWFLRV